MPLHHFATSMLQTLVPTSYLRWLANRKCYSIDSSALGWPMGRFPAALDVLPCAAGFEAPGEQAEPFTATMQEMRRDSDGDITCVVYGVGEMRIEVNAD